MGDGFIERAKPTHNAKIRIEQSYPEKSEYLESLYNIFEPLTTMKPTILTINNNKRGVSTKSIYFITLAMPCLNYYHELFYKEGLKIIPKNLSELLTARGLSYWILDDGGKYIHNKTLIHTRSFSKSYVEFLQSILHKTLGY